VTDALSSRFGVVVNAQEYQTMLKSIASMARRITRVVGLLPLVFACHSSTDPIPGDLASARARWTAASVTDYEVTVHRSCFCPTEMDTPVIVTVRGGVVVGRRYATTNAAVSAQFAQYFPAVDGLFGVVDDALARHADTLDAHYDAQLGFPTLVSIDYVKDAVDDELSVDVTSFRRL
jgi:hypothetical protein